MSFFIDLRYWFQESIDQMGYFMTIGAPISFFISMIVFVLGFWEYGIRPLFGF